jgi:hypothetical protein
MRYLVKGPSCLRFLLDRYGMSPDGIADAARKLAG